MSTKKPQGEMRVVLKQMRLDRRGTSAIKYPMSTFFISIAAFAFIIKRNRYVLPDCDQLPRLIGRRGLETVAETIHAPAGAQRAITGRGGLER